MTKIKSVEVELLGKTIRLPLKVDTVAELRGVEKELGGGFDSSKRIKEMKSPKWGKGAVLKDLMFDVASQIDVDKFEDKLRNYQDLVRGEYGDSWKGLRDDIERDGVFLEAVKSLKLYLEEQENDQQN